MKKQSTTNENYKHLFEIAGSQLGLFTSKQAVSAGFSTNNHSYHEKSGNWIREIRGIYRLAQFPQSQLSHYMLWYLWSRDRNDVPQGVLSHETALSLFELSDLMPSKIHMTVPKSFRKGTKIPDILVLHYGNIPEKDTQTLEGFRVTKPIRSITDLLSERRISEEFIFQGVSQGVSQGRITLPELRQSSLPADFKERIIKSIRGVA